MTVTSYSPVAAHPSVVLQANVVLEYLSTNLEPDWQQALTRVFSDAEQDIVIDNVNNLIEESLEKRLVGAWLGGTGVLKSYVGLAGEDMQQAIRLLKETRRIAQVGKGRGRALLVFSTEPLALFAGESDDSPSAPVPTIEVESSVVAQPPQQPDVAPRKDTTQSVTTLFDALHRIIDEMHRLYDHTQDVVNQKERQHAADLFEIERLQAELTSTSQTLQTLEERLHELEDQLAQAHSKISLQTLTTWQ